MCAGLGSHSSGFPWNHRKFVVFVARGPPLRATLPQCNAAGIVFHGRRFGRIGHAIGRRRTKTDDRKWKWYRIVSAENPPIPINGKTNNKSFSLHFSRSSRHSEDYKKFVEQPSGNMDDTGFFSVQVISRALALWSLDLIPLNSTDEYATQIRNDPTKAQAFIFNMDSHWFCVRRFPNIKTGPNCTAKDSFAFFNLNSLLSKPEYMSSLYLTEYLKQMLNEGYSIFVVNGIFPECPADTNPPVMLQSSRLDGAKSYQFVDLTKSESTKSVSETDADLQRAIQLSLELERSQSSVDTPSTSYHVDSATTASTSKTLTATDQDLEAALQMSLECFNQPINQSQLRDKRLAYFESLSSNDKQS